MTRARWVAVVCAVVALLAVAWMLVPFTAQSESCSGAIQTYGDTNPGLQTGVKVDSECSREAHTRVGTGMLLLVLAAGVGGAAVYVDRRPRA